jgi:hypothetical protein
MNEVSNTFIYSYAMQQNLLHRTTLSTGSTLSFQIRAYLFRLGCCWSELPGGLLLITGGEPGTEAVECIDTLREFAAYRMPPMLSPRKGHCSLYYADYLYVLGGEGPLEQCERYATQDNHWEALPGLPMACSYPSAAVVESTLYALGGRQVEFLDLIQRLSLLNLTWEVMQVRLPTVGAGIPCFTLDESQVYFVLRRTLYLMLPLEQRVHEVQQLAHSLTNWYGPSYYSKGALYCSSYTGPAVTVGLKEFY